MKAVLMFIAGCFMFSAGLLLLGSDVDILRSVLGLLAISAGGLLIWHRLD